MLFHSAKSISDHFTTLKNFEKISKKFLKFFEFFRPPVSYIGFFKFSPKRFSESLKLSSDLILHRPNKT